MRNLFSRAWQQKYLTPAERAIYKFSVALIVLIPSSAILSAVAATLNGLHAAVPSRLWSILAVLLPALLFMAAKYASAHSDAQVGAIIQQVEAGAVLDITTMPANPNPVRVPTALVMPVTAQEPPKADSAK